MVRLTHPISRSLVRIVPTLLLLYCLEVQYTLDTLPIHPSVVLRYRTWRILLHISLVEVRNCRPGLFNIGFVQTFTTSTYRAQENNL